jgi:hypothetical protein
MPLIETIGPCGRGAPDRSETAPTIRHSGKSGTLSLSGMVESTQHSDSWQRKWSLALTGKRLK